MSVTTSPSTESPRNSRRSFVTSSPCSNANERCVSAASRSPASRNATPSARSSASIEAGSRSIRTRLLDLDGLTAGVVPAVPAHAVRHASAACTADTSCTRSAPPSTSHDASRCGSCSASSWGLPSVPPGRSASGRVVGRRELEQQVGQDREPRIDRVVPRALAEVAVAAARRAQTQAVGPAQRRERHLDADRVADRSGRGRPAPRRARSRRRRRPPGRARSCDQLARSRR